MKKTVLLTLLFLALPGVALAFFTDIETVVANLINTASLDLVLANQNQVQDSSSVDVLKTTNSSDLKYKISFAADNPAGVCGQYSLKISLNSITLYDGLLTSLSDFRVADWEITGSTVQTLVFDYALSADLAPEYLSQTCEFKYLFTAWDKEFTDASMGFTDTEEWFLTLAPQATPTPTAEAPTLTPTPTPDSGQCRHENSECHWNQSGNDCCPGLVCAEWQVTGGEQRYKCEVTGLLSTTTTSSSTETVTPTPTAEPTETPGLEPTVNSETPTPTETPTI